MEDIHLADNLRKLCLQAGSIAKVCRDTDINRQQMARYLSGTSTPRLELIKRLCIYLNVSPNILFEPLRPDHFLDAQKGGLPDWFVNSIEPYFFSDYPADKHMEPGFYVSWRVSSLTPGHVIRNIMFIEEGGDHLQAFRWNYRPPYEDRTTPLAKSWGCIGMVGTSHLFLGRMQVHQYSTITMSLVQAAPFHDLYSGLWLRLTQSSSAKPVVLRIVFRKCRDVRLSSLKNARGLVKFEDVPPSIAYRLGISEQDVPSTMETL